MKYRLKDHELQRKLDEISDGDFSARLHKERELIKDSFKKEPRLHVLWFGEGSQFSAALYADMLEEVREYDPRAWNDYSKVNPPEGVLMRVECHDGSKACAKYRLFIEGGSWCDINGGAWPEAYSQSVARFRPWDDPDGEEDEE